MYNTKCRRMVYITINTAIEENVDGLLLYGVLC